MPQQAQDPSRRRSRTDDSLDQFYDSSSDHSGGSHHHQNQDSHHPSSNWRVVPRPRTSAHPDSHQTPRGPAFPPDLPEPLHPRHSRSSMSQSYQVGNAAFHPRPLTRQPLSTTSSSPLNLASLQQLDRRAAPTNSMACWMQEHQQDAPWNGVGHVRNDNLLPQHRRRRSEGEDS
ncbi:hypothetical protein CC78DRAFT_541979 [Lojkania enalia]|uniref:Uncharacterized protein n=1 Tax=Lojkania enalia TaxID=147567 RepID=A0A9P4KD34_9PLEO|nr:hypothetical protein CC78DRAFT_541979 [Didymosphaeria enalia]